MKTYRHHWILLALSMSLFGTAYSLAQDQSASQDNAAKPLTPKEIKKRQKQLIKELGPPEITWLNDEVPDIITPEERQAFLELSTNEEREQFKEIFWNK